MRLVVVLALLALALPAHASPIFVPLGDLPGFGFYSVATAVSDDGSTVVGESISSNGYEAFVWTSGGGMEGLGDLAGGTFQSAAFDVSADGTTVVGRGAIAGSGSEAFRYETFRWTRETGMIGIGAFIGGALSPDGSTIFGSGTTGVVRWTEEGGMVSLGSLAGYSSIGVSDISADGSTIVGTASTEFTQEAFRWTGETGIVGLGDLPGHSFWSEAAGVSADGSVVVGTANGALVQDAFRWTAGGGMVGLSPPPPSSDRTYANARAVSGDGSIVVGEYSGFSGSGFIWDEAHGMRRLDDVFTLLGLGPQIAGWTLSATGISADGQTIVGSGRNPLGQTEAWIVVIPEPGSLALVALGLAGMWLARCS